MPHSIHLSKDKKLHKILKTQKPVVLSRKRNVCLQLCYSIMSQQLSTKVAAVFHNRFLALYDNKVPRIAQIAATKKEVLRSIGLSQAKAQYVLNVAHFFMEEKITDGALYKMSNEASHCLPHANQRRWSMDNRDDINVYHRSGRCFPCK
jgi:DNA-3-methyladenine glycosylase II